MVVCSISSFYMFHKCTRFLPCGYHEGYVKHFIDKTFRFMLTATSLCSLIKAPSFTPSFHNIDVTIHHFPVVYWLTTYDRCSYFNYSVP